MGKKVLITAALPYINNVPHMGHIVGSHLPADIFYRYQKLIGNDATFVGGADEYGTPAVVTAQELGTTPAHLVDKLKVEHRKVYEKFGISYTNFSGTRNGEHKTIVKDFFNKLKENGFIEEQEIEMLYCEKCGRFLPDRFIVGTCPKCGYDKAYGDQCDKCCSVYSTSDLVHPRCSTCDTQAVYKKSKHFFFKFDKASEKLNEWLETKKNVFRPYVYAEAKRWIKDGLQSRCITRDMAWGVPVEEEGYENKVFYVWFEAPIGYISITKELGDEFYNKYWKEEGAEIYNFLGKDNIPFHTVFFPAWLLSNGTYNLPYNVSGYNFLNYEGQKFSKSKKIGVFSNALLTSDVDVDALRGYLTSILPENKDSDWKWEEFKNVTNSDILGKLGNFFNRTINLIYKNFPDGLDYGAEDLTDLTEEDNTIIEAIKTEPAKICALYDKIELREAFKQVINLSTVGNVYLEHTAPWSMIKNGDMKGAAKVLYLCLNLAKALALLAYPVLPFKMEEVYSQLNFENISAEGNLLTLGNIDVEKCHKVNAPAPLFRRIDDDYLNKLKEEFSEPFDMEKAIKD